MSRCVPVRAAAAVALLVGVLALAGCGESAQAKAKKQVCNARNDIAKQITTLQKLAINAGAARTAKASFEAIGKDVTQIKNVQKSLDTARRKEVETATHDFVTRVGIERIRAVIAEDCEGFGAALDAAMQASVDTAYDPWKEAAAPKTVNQFTSVIAAVEA